MTNQEKVELVEQYNRVCKLVQDLFNKVTGTDAVFVPISGVKDTPKEGSLIKIVTE